MHWIRGLSLEQYQEIASKCTEVDCSVECDIKEVADVMLRLKDRLVKLGTSMWDDCVEVDEAEDDDEAFYGGYFGEEYTRKAFDIFSAIPVEKLNTAASKCVRLRELNFSTGDGQSTHCALRAICFQLRPGLEMLSIALQNEDRPREPETWDSQNVLPILRKFYFHDSPNSCDCFSGLGRACPLIETL